MKIDGYLRVSQVAGREGESFISPREQHEPMRGWARGRGHEIARIHDDLDFSGGTAERPGLKRAMERIRRGTVQGLVVKRLDRFGRSIQDTANLLAEIRDAGGVLYSIDEGIDTSNHMGGFLTGIFSSLAELELERFRDNWSAARRRAVGRGIHVASRTPTGYLRRSDRRLEPDPAAASHITKVFEAKAQGASWGELAAILEGAGVETPYGGTKWVQRSLSHMVSNRVYLGEARSGEFKQPASHLPLIDPETWELAQRIKQPSTNGKGASMLSGLLRCAGCRYSMKPDKQKDRKGDRIRVYSCRRNRAAGRCGDPSSVLGSVVEPWVIEHFFEGLGDVSAEAVRASTELREMQEQADKAALELSAYRDSSAVEIIGAQSFGEGLRVRADRLSGAEDALERKRQEAEGAELPDAATLRGSWPDLDVGERRQLLHLGIDAIFVRSCGRANVPISERALIFFRGEGPDDLPGRGRRCNTIRPFDWPS
jgi:site-specific DNA recombinase